MLKVGRADAAVRAASRRTDPGGRLPGRRRQHPHRLRRDRRRGAGGASRRRQGGLHRLDRGRQADRQGGGRQPEEGDAGAGRQVAGDRVRRRRPRPRRSPARPAPSSSTTASAAAPARGSTRTRACSTRWSRACRPRRGKIKRRAGPRSRRPTWVRWCPRSSSSASPAIIESGLAEGAKVMAGGGTRRATAATSSQPTVLTNTKPDMKVVREEIFGPVVCAIALRRRGSRSHRQPGQRHHLRARGQRLDQGHLQGAQAGGAAAVRHGLDQLPQRVRRLAAVRRLQAVGLGPRDGRVRAGELSRGQGGHDRPDLSGRICTGGRGPCAAAGSGPCSRHGPHLSSRRPAAAGPDRTRQDRAAGGDRPQRLDLGRGSRARHVVPTRLAAGGRAEQAVRSAGGDDAVGRQPGRRRCRSPPWAAISSPGSGPWSRRPSPWCASIWGRSRPWRSGAPARNRCREPSGLAGAQQDT